MLIKKVKQIIPIVSKVVQDLSSNSETDVPSVSAVNEGMASIIETITNENGTAIKFPDGTMICTMERSFYGTCTNTFGVLYETEQFDFGDFPIPFISEPTLSVLDFTGGFVGAIRDRSKNHIGKANFARPNKIETITGWGVEITAIGRWK